jgi:glutamine synthetase
MPPELALDLLQALEAEGLAPQQFHPEGGPGMYEVSLGIAEALAAADNVLVLRETIRDLARRHGLVTSFAPMVFAEGEGYGAHLHMSLWDESEQNLFAMGPGPHGLTDTGESFLAGVLEHIDALVAITCPSVVSYLRLQPTNWAGAYACWGLENREAALRFITGLKGEAPTAANVEFKPIDSAANPHIAVGAVLAAGADGISRQLKLPPPTTGNPAMMAENSLTHRLPASLHEATSKLLESRLLREAMGEQFFDAFVGVRQCEIATLGGLDPVEAVRAHRWRY